MNGVVECCAWKNNINFARLVTKTLLASLFVYELIFVLYTAENVFFR